MSVPAVCACKVQWFEMSVVDLANEQRWEWRWCTCTNAHRETTSSSENAAIIVSLYNAFVVVYNGFVVVWFPGAGDGPPLPINGAA